MWNSVPVIAHKGTHTRHRTPLEASPPIPATTALGSEAGTWSWAAWQRRRCWAPRKGLTALGGCGERAGQEGPRSHVDGQLCFACLRLSLRLTPKDLDKPQRSPPQVQESGLSWQPEDRAVAAKPEGLLVTSFASQNNCRK